MWSSDKWIEPRYFRQFSQWGSCLLWLSYSIWFMNTQWLGFQQGYYIQLVQRFWVKYSCGWNQRAKCYVMILEGTDTRHRIWPDVSDEPTSVKTIYHIALLDSRLAELFNPEDGDCNPREHQQTCVTLYGVTTQKCPSLHNPFRARRVVNWKRKKTVLSQHSRGGTE
jgi:hypothetical protein